MGKIIILPVIRGQRSSNCTTATKGGNSRNRASNVRATWNCDRHMIGYFSPMQFFIFLKQNRFLDREQITIGRGFLASRLLGRVGFYLSYPPFSTVKFPCDNMSNWHGTRNGVNISHPLRAGEEAERKVSRFAFHVKRVIHNLLKIKLDGGGIVLYSWDIKRKEIKCQI